MVIESGSSSNDNTVNNNGVGASTFRSMRSNYSSTDNPNFRTNYSQTASYISNKPRIICDYCKKPGHTRDKCYKLHGYPHTNNQNANISIQNGYRGNNQNPRFNKGKGLMADVQGDGCSGEDEHKGTHDDTCPHLTRE
ncbi:hypothetical protein H5410_005268 [Solanum commersonii]|uniref:Uncharacterized protein n=1 Tax=Solanum commersonii TaxID=4109 RepID=A0A9J6A6S0_SOLCO|nr:hypothetical protein H5410_005268 [Solanum commersonii]